MDVATIILSVAGSGAVTAMVSSALSLPRSTRGELNAMRHDLTECQGDCAEAKDEARRARLETDEWRRLNKRNEEEADRARAEAEREREAAKYWRDRYNREIGGTGA